MKVVIKWCAGMMPNQAEGTIDDKPFYFRARHGYWSLDIDGKEVAEGEHPNAGWFQPSEAQKFLLTVIQSLKTPAK